MREVDRSGERKDGGMRAAVWALSCVSAIVTATPVSADSSAERGREVFWNRCISCHAIDCNRNGPKLKGVIGRKAGTVPEFSGYSDALKNSGIVWSIDVLDQFLRKPAAMVPGIRQMDRVDMGFVKDPQDRRDLIAYLASGDTSLDICPK